MFLAIGMTTIMLALLVGFKRVFKWASRELKSVLKSLRDLKRVREEGFFRGVSVGAKELWGNWD